MEALLSQLETESQADLSHAWERYRQLLTGDDDSPSAASELQSIMHTLKLSPAHVRKHAAALVEAEHLEAAAAGLAEAKRDCERVRATFAGALKECEDAKKAAEERYRDARNADMAARHRVNEGLESEQKLRTLRVEFPFLFSAADAPGAELPEAIRKSYDAPASVDERLLHLDPARGYSAEELAAAGLPAADLLKAEKRGVSRFPDGSFHGSTLVEWARAMRKTIRALRRRDVQAAMEPVSEKALKVDPEAVLSPHELFSIGIPRRMRARGFPRADAMKFGHWNGGTIRAWAVAAKARHDRLTKELAELDALDRAEAASVVGEVAPEREPAIVDVPAESSAEVANPPEAAGAASMDLLADLDMRDTEDKSSASHSRRRAKTR